MIWGDNSSPPSQLPGWLSQLGKKFTDSRSSATCQPAAGKPSSDHLHRCAWNGRDACRDAPRGSTSAEEPLAVLSACGLGCPVLPQHGTTWLGGWFLQQAGGMGRRVVLESSEAIFGMLVQTGICASWRKCHRQGWLSVPRDPVVPIWMSDTACCYQTADVSCSWPCF